RNDGTGTFTDATATHMPAESHPTTAVALGDVDGDGDLDLILGIAEPTGGQSRLDLDEGTGRLPRATATRVPPGIYTTSSLALGDVDGDLDLDLVVGNQSQRSRLYLNNGTGRFSDATAARMPVAYDATNCLLLGDLDGDGDLDLVLGNDGPNRLYLNDGTGTFTDGPAARVPVAYDWTQSLALGDVDGDGDLDLLIGNGDAYAQSLLFLNDGTGT